MFWLISTKYARNSISCSRKCKEISFPQKSIFCEKFAKMFPAIYWREGEKGRGEWGWGGGGFHLVGHLFSVLILVYIHIFANIIHCKVCPLLFIILPLKSLTSHSLYKFELVLYLPGENQTKFQWKN